VTNGTHFLWAYYLPLIHEQCIDISVTLPAYALPCYGQDSLFVLIYHCKILCCGCLSFIMVDNDDLQVAVGPTVITLVIHS